MRRKEQEREEVNKSKNYLPTLCLAPILFATAKKYLFIQVLSHRRHRDDANVVFQVKPDSTSKLNLYSFIERVEKYVYTCSVHQHNESLHNLMIH